MVPAVIISGFRRSGIYPFNPEAINYGVSVDISKKPISKRDDSKSKSKASKGDDFNSRSKNLQAKAIEFSADKKRSFNEGMKRASIFRIHCIFNSLKLPILLSGKLMIPKLM